MSTGYSNRFAELAKMGEVVFHTDDLANLWNITNKNTLYTTLKRYVDQGLLFRIHKGFYAIKPAVEIDLFLLGVKALHSQAYVSTESILSASGIIQQEVPAVTLISDSTKRFSVAGNRYYSRKLADKFLYQPEGIETDSRGTRKSTVVRAVADMLYFNARAYFDASHLIDWHAVERLQKEIGYPPTPHHYG